MSRWRIHNPLHKLLITVAVLVYALVIALTPLSCPFWMVTGLPCPGCGMSRALLALVRLDIKTAFSYHLMVWSLPILYLCFLFDGKLFQKKWLNGVLYGILAVGFLIHWLRALVF